MTEDCFICQVHANHVRDSTTILAWDVQIIEQAAEPSNSFEEEVNSHC
ncbi:hypothetical protein JOC54_003111 [Alkalihalobacillus xiaoxiensis]|uniref:Uncharacterized protein n=1 Tax=Shouchella xiaoxiensis TaxID=766895 RepID=A0ABS2SXT0_9BACI|nr:hypothetical protein [Shouchella xiaoxiensis]MBM7839831.1 hypothetical protein [Shouchella xiaoxiensis]